MGFDINPFEAVGKVVRRTEETLQDGYCAMQEAMCKQGLHGLERGIWANEQGVAILAAAHEAVTHDDMKEAEHQLKRGIYFSSIFPQADVFPGIEASCHAGLKALQSGSSATEIYRAMDEAFLDMEGNPHRYGADLLPVE